MPYEPVPWSRLQRLNSQDITGLLDEYWDRLGPSGISREFELEHTDWVWHIDDGMPGTHSDHGDIGPPAGIKLEADGRISREAEHTDWVWHIDDGMPGTHSDHGDSGPPADIRFLRERLEFYIDQLEEVLVQREAQMASGLITKIRGALADVTERLSSHEDRLSYLERNVGRTTGDG